MVSTLKKTAEKAARKSDWGQRHMNAVVSPSGFESPIVCMVTAWELYAAVHKNRYDSLIGEDGVLGVEWADMGKCLRGMINGDLGRLDGGTMDSTIFQIAEANGVELE